MSSSVAIFHKFVESLGQQFAPGDIVASSGRPPALWSALGEMARIIRAIEARTAGSPQPFRFVAGRIASVTPTGYCSLVDGHYCLGITTAFHYCCYEAAFRLFQSDQTFLDLEPPAEAPSPDIDEAGMRRPWGFVWARLLRGHASRFARPEDATPFDPCAAPDYEASFAVPSPLRAACATYVMLAMGRFLWQHEWAHAVSGHLPYLLERQRIQTLSENDWLEVPDDRQLATAIRVWMEYDADTSAIGTLLRGTLEGGTVTLTGVDAVDSNIGLRSRLDVMAFVLTLLVILVRHDWTTDPGTHPNPFRRIFVAVCTALQVLQDAHPDPEPIANAIVSDIKALCRANQQVHYPLLMFFDPVTFRMETQEYNDLLAYVGAEVPRIRAHSFFEADGTIRA